MSARSSDLAADGQCDPKVGFEASLRRQLNSVEDWFGSSALVHFAAGTSAERAIAVGENIVLLAGFNQTVFDLGSNTIARNNRRNDAPSWAAGSDIAPMPPQPFACFKMR